jgi:acetoin utilization protein AcuC
MTLAVVRGTRYGGDVDDEQLQAMIAWDEDLLGYDFGPGHPMSPTRLALTIRLARDLQLLDHIGVEVTGAAVPDDEMLLRVHSPEYLAAVREAPKHPYHPVMGLGTEDVPVFPGMHEASAAIVAATDAVARAVWSGRVQHGVNIAGGLHHAMPSQASGFCVYNDSAVAIAGLLAAGARRVAYVDVDVHHGDGVERIFWDDPRVLTVSIHESGQSLFPGTGFALDIGGPSALGSVVNIALPAGTGSAGWLRAFQAVVPVMVRSFEPEILVSQQGCDSHVLDPLANLALSIDCQRTSYELLHELAHEVCEGRWVAVGGGGYELVDVVPRAWSHLIAIATHRPIDPQTAVPEGWLDYVSEVYGRTGPRRMTDGDDGGYRSWASGHDPADPVDRAVMATRKAVFPLHGLDPWFD